MVIITRAKTMEGKAVIYAVRALRRGGIPQSRGVLMAACGNR